MKRILLTLLIALVAVFSLTGSAIGATSLWVSNEPDQIPAIGALANPNDDGAITFEGQVGDECTFTDETTGEEVTGTLQLVDGDLVCVAPDGRSSWGRSSWGRSSWGLKFNGQTVSINSDTAVKRIAGVLKKRVKSYAGRNGGWKYRVGNHTPPMYGCDFIAQNAMTCPYTFEWNTYPNEAYHKRCGTAKARVDDQGRYFVRLVKITSKC